MFVILTGGIDLSVGAIIGLTNVVAASLPCVDTPFNIVLWAVVPVLVGVFVVGLSNGFIIAHWEFPPFIVTLATSTIWTGVTFFIMDVPGGDISMSVYRSVTGSFLGLFLSFDDHNCCAIYHGFYLKNTVFGHSVYAIGGNKEISVESGIPAKRVETMVYGP